MKEALVDVSVLLVFFTRQDTLQQVFNRVKEARPARLFLYQDGPREGRPDDAENICKCRDIVSDIDWNCEVHTLYQQQNYGPDESGYIADTWAFAQTDKCIVIEDDVVPTLSFFSFCKEMLDRYEHDERVMLISAQNLEEETKGMDSDYFFSRTMFTWGWASWSRVVSKWDAYHEWLKDAKQVARMQRYIREHHLSQRWLHYFGPLAEAKTIRFESSLIARQLLDQGLTIVPTRNMACNIGLGTGSVHYEAQLSQMARGDRQIFMLKAFEADTAHLKHPADVSDYAPYQQRAYRIRAWGHPLIRTWRTIETTYYQLRSGANRRKVFETVLLKARLFLSGNYS